MNNYFNKRWKLVSVLSELNFFEILFENLTLESKWFLAILSKQQQPINKEQLGELVNTMYIAKQSSEGVENPSPLIGSRYPLDIHTARLEGAGLVKVTEHGRMRFYSITKLGKQLLEYTANKN